MIDQLREERTKLHEQHFFLEKLIAASPIAILILDFDNRIASLNAKAQVFFKVPPEYLSGKILAETDLPLLAELGTLLDGESRIVENQWRRNLQSPAVAFHGSGIPALVSNDRGIDRRTAGIGEKKPTEK